MNYQVADQLQTAYDGLWHTLALLEPTELETGRLENQWTPKTLLAHVGFWDECQRQRMEAALRGETAQTGFTFPALGNDERAALDEARPWNEVATAADTARQALIVFARSLKSADLERDYPEGEQPLSLAKLLAHMVRHTQLHTAELYRYAGSMQRWARPALRVFLIRQHNNLMDGLSGLTEQTMLQTQVCGVWSIRDVLTHVLAWHEFSFMVLQGWPRVAVEKLGPWHSDGDTDALNAQLLAERSHLTMIEICDGLMTHHRRILRAFDRASDEDLRSSGDYGWGEEGALSGLFYSFALHEAKHAADIWRFRAGQ